MRWRSRRSQVLCHSYKLTPIRSTSKSLRTPKTLIALELAKPGTTMRSEAIRLSKSRIPKRGSGTTTRSCRPNKTVNFSKIHHNARPIIGSRGATARTPTTTIASKPRWAYTATTRTWHQSTSSPRESSGTRIVRNLALCSKRSTCSYPTMTTTAVTITSQLKPKSLKCISRRNGWQVRWALRKDQDSGMTIALNGIRGLRRSSLSWRNWEMQTTAGHRRETSRWLKSIS